jgi:hypothetical protein
LIRSGKPPAVVVTRIDKYTLPKGPDGRDRRMDRRRGTDYARADDGAPAAPIHGWVRDVASTHGSHLAACDNLQTLTYAQLESRATALVIDVGKLEAFCSSCADGR